MAAGISVDDADAIAVGGRKHHRERGELEERGALGAGAGAELQRECVLKDDEDGELAFLDEFFAERFAEARGDVPVDVADIVAEIIFYNLVELHAAPAEHRTVFAGERILDGFFHAPLELAQQRDRRRRKRRPGGENGKGVR